MDGIYCCQNISRGSFWYTCLCKRTYCQACYELYKVNDFVGKLGMYFSKDINSCKLCTDDFKLTELTCQEFHNHAKENEYTFSEIHEKAKNIKLEKRLKNTNKINAAYKTTGCSICKNGLNGKYYYGCACGFTYCSKCYSDHKIYNYDETDNAGLTRCTRLITECRLCTLDPNLIELTAKEFYQYAKENESTFNEIYERAKYTKFKDKKSQGLLTKKAI